MDNEGVAFSDFFSINCAAIPQLSIVHYPLSIFSTGPVECGKIFCGKKFSKILSTEPVENSQFSTFGMWKKSRCGSKKNDTFPHNFPLLLLLLPNISFCIYISIIF